MKVMLHLDYDLDAPDRCAMRRQYRSLRLAMYAPQSSPYATTRMYQGCYGKTRDEAREFLAAFYQEVAWHNYIGSK